MAKHICYFLLFGQEKILDWPVVETLDSVSYHSIFMLCFHKITTEDIYQLLRDKEFSCKNLQPQLWNKNVNCLSLFLITPEQSHSHKLTLNKIKDWKTSKGWIKHLNKFNEVKVVNTSWNSPGSCDSPNISDFNRVRQEDRSSNRYRLISDCPLVVTKNS